MVDYDGYTPPQQSRRRSRQMESAAFILGIIAMILSCLVYPALICGALSIVFALLSRGGELTFTPKAKAGLVMGSAGLVIVAALTIWTLIVAQVYYGGVEEMMREMYGQLGLDYDAIFRFSSGR